MMGMVVMVEIKNLKNDEYMEIFLESGKIVDFYKEKRDIGWLKMGLMSYFTKPWVNIHGKENCLNEVVYLDFKDKLDIECVRCFE